MSKLPKKCSEELSSVVVDAVAAAAVTSHEDLAEQVHSADPIVACSDIRHRNPTVSKESHRFPGKHPV